MGHLAKQKYERMPLALNVCNKKKRFCVLQKKVLSFGPNRTVEVLPNSSAEPNVRSFTTVQIIMRILLKIGSGRRTFLMKINKIKKCQK